VSPEQVLTIIAIVTAAWTGNRLLRSPIAQALARRIAGRDRAGAAHDGEVAELRARVLELEERVDFTERVLAQREEKAQLGKQGSAT
jgi:hypothetical protein